MWRTHTWYVYLDDIKFYDSADSCVRNLLHIADIFSSEIRIECSLYKRQMQAISKDHHKHRTGHRTGDFHIEAITERGFYKGYFGRKL